MPKILDLFVLLRRRRKITETHREAHRITVPCCHIYSFCLLPLLLCASSLSSSVLYSPFLGQIIHRMLIRSGTNLTPVPVSCSNHQPSSNRRVRTTFYARGHCSNPRSKTKTKNAQYWLMVVWWH